MNALKKIINNLQKYATTVTSIKNDVNAVTQLLTEERSSKETVVDKETPGSEIGVNAAMPPTIDTNECLKEFDDILAEINKDVTKDASLDDIDDILKDMEQEDTKGSMFEVPRFHLAEISALKFENLKDDDVEINSLLSLDDSIVSLSDEFIANINEVIEQNDVISISSVNSQPDGSVKNISTGNIDQIIDVNSTNTEDTKENKKHSESIECEKLHNKYIGAEEDQGIEKQTTLYVTTNEVINKTSDPKDKTNEGFQNHLVESSKEVNDTTKDVVFTDHSDDYGYQSSYFEFITEEEAKMDGLIINFKKDILQRKTAKVKMVKTIEIAVNQFSNARKSASRKQIKRKTRNIDKDPDWAPDSDTDSTSDDEIIPDDMEYLSRNNTRSKNNNTPAKSPVWNNTLTFRLRQIRILPKTNNGSPGLQINSDNLTSRNITVNNGNEERYSPDRNNVQEFGNECRNEFLNAMNEIHLECKDESNLLKTETDDLELFKQNLAQIDHLNANLNQDIPGKLSDLNKVNPGSSFMQENHPDSNNKVVKTNKHLDGPELNNIGPTLKSPEINYFDHSQRPEENIILETSTENVPDPNMLNPGPSTIQNCPKLDNFGRGQSCKRNRSHDDEIEKWRMYQIRTRLNRPKLIVDYSYRDQHRIFQDNDLHQLFDPNRAPVPTARSIRLLENKSTVCKNSMLVEYQGVGFDVPLRDSGSEDDEVKQEANECAKKILEMYPGQNTRRPRRRF